MNNKPSFEELLVLKRAIANEQDPLWPAIQLWMMDMPTATRGYVYRHLYGSQSDDESLFTPIFEVYAEWSGEILRLRSYRYHNHPQMDLIDSHSPIEKLEKIDMKKVMP